MAKRNQVKDFKNSCCGFLGHHVLSWLREEWGIGNWEFVNGEWRMGPENSPLTIHLPNSKFPIPNSQNVPMFDFA